LVIEVKSFLVDGGFGRFGNIPNLGQLGRECKIFFEGGGKAGGESLALWLGTNLC
jgi:hypothetical protein